MNNFRQAMAPPPDIATLAELDQRLAARVRPQMERHLSPSPHQRLDAVRATAVTNEERIAKLTCSLDEARVKIGLAYSINSLEGRARAHFEHER